MLFRDGGGCPYATLTRDDRHEQKPADEEQIEDEKVRMIEHQDRHAGYSRDQHINHVDQDDHNGPREHFCFHKTVGLCAGKGFLSDAWQVLGHRQCNAHVQPLEQRLHCAGLQDPEESNEEKADQHDQGKRDDHDRLDRVGEGIRQLLNGERDDQRENADCDGV